MGDKWMAGNWREISSTNKDNRNKSKIFSITSFVPMTKYKYEMIFREVVGEPSHGHILGMGIGIKAKDVYGLTLSGKGCSKRCREDFTKEKEDLEARLREEMDSKLAKVMEKLKEKFAQKL